MNDTRNMILAVVLSAILLLGWGWLSNAYFPTANPPVSKVEKGKTVPLPQPQASPAADTPQAIRDRNLVLRETAAERVPIQTPRLAGSINLRGARIDDLTLTTERETIAADSPPIRLFSPSGTRDSYFAEFGWTQAPRGTALPNATTLWQRRGDRLTPGSPVTLWWDNGQGQRFEIVLSVDANYLFGAEQRVINRGTGRFVARPYSTVSRAGALRNGEIDGWTVHIGPMGVFNGAADYDSNFSDVAEAGRLRFESHGGWIGFTDKYWLAAVIPSQGSAVNAEFLHVGASDRYQASYLAPTGWAGPNRMTTYASHVFAGAKEIELLETYSDSLGTQLEQAVDWGWFEWFMKPIFMLLNWLFHTIGNFGVAIICLTLIVRTLLFPIAQKQFASFGKMRVIQPKMKAIQERYADDKPRMQQEVMKLYKEEKVNPAAGCLPILLQIPIFYALYKVLMVSVEMRHKPFALWIQDLSAPDPLTPVNLFGYLDFTPPHMLAIGVLPILLGITMWLQFKLNPQVPDPVQRQIFALMPWILMFAMSSFAAGLQLYWVTNNILTIAQQKWLYSRNPAMKTPPPPATAPPPPPPPSEPRKGRMPRAK
ncbi:MAG TPA: membrane protein insertase YidC [Allosphingosinicella sp.]|nr:membrane protein insertase YidC [Allosphingosinicella sp.]